jgi:hypothetical protein
LIVTLHPRILEIHIKGTRHKYSIVPAHTEPVSDDAPEFLMSEDGQE